MRVASWVLVLCTTLGAVALFVPSFELRLGGRPGGSALARRTERSLHQVSTDRAFLNQMIAAYHRTAKRGPGESPVRTIHRVTDRELGTATRIGALTVWGLVALDALIALLVLGELWRGTYGRARLLLALVLSAAVTAAAIALHIVGREAVWKLNHAIGAQAIAIRPGLNLLPLAAIAALVAAVVLVARERTPPPPPRRVLRPRAR